MDNAKEFEGKTLDDAIGEACAYYDAPREKLEIDIVQDAKSGIFGLVGVRRAIIRARRAEVIAKVGNILGSPRKNHVSAAPRGRDADAAGNAGRERPEHPTRPESRPDSRADNRPVRSDGSDRADRLDRADRSDRPESRPDRPRTAYSDTPAFEQASSLEQPRPDRLERTDRADRTNTTATTATTGRNARPNTHPNRVERPMRPERAAEAVRPERPDRAERPVRPERPVRQERPDRSPAHFTRLDADLDFQSDPGMERLHFTPLEELDQERLHTVVLDAVRQLIEPIIGPCDLDIEIGDGRVAVHIHSEEDLGLLIGREGQTLSCLQYLAARISARQMASPIRLQLDAGDYRERQDGKLRELALMLADRARTTGRVCPTRPLSSYQRRIVHMALQGDPTIQTRSAGDGPLKRVVIQRARTEA